MAVRAVLKSARKIDSGPLKPKGYIDGGPGVGKRDQSIQDILKTFRKSSARKRVDRRARTPRLPR